MPAARGVKRSASKAAEVKPAAAGSSKSKKKSEPKAPLISGDLKIPKSRGQVFTVGQGDVGQLGHGEDHLEKTRFTRVTSLPSNIVDICAGGMHTVALDKDGHVWTFGCNDEGALGRDSEGSNSEWTPSKVALPGKAVSVSAGDSHTAALLTTAQVFAWGSFRDSHGNMGLTLKGNERKPVEMLPGHRVVQIASGGDHLIMLTDMGQVFTCGCGEQGQLGRVTARSCDRHSRMGLNGLLVPAPLAFSRDKVDFEAVWAGTHCTFARRAAKGDIYVWGLNNYQQIGVRKGSPQTVFTPVISEAFNCPEVEKWTMIAGGQHHTLALDDKGHCYSLGRREYGRLGLGEASDDAKDLTVIPALEEKKCISISCGSAASFAVTDNGEVYAWGMGTSGQLGTGKEDDELVPKLLCKGQLEGRKATSVSAGGQHTVLLVASEDAAEDEVEEAEKSDTAPHTKVEDEKTEAMEVEDAKPDKSDKDAAIEEKKGGRKAAAKRGRKRSNSSSSSTTETSKPVAKKQNGGSPVPEETAQEVAEAEKDDKSGSTIAEKESQPHEEEKLKTPQAPEEKQAKAGKEEQTEEDAEPKSKKIKLDVDKADTPAAEDKPKEEETVPTPEAENNKTVEKTKEVVEKMEVEEKLSNGNGDAEDSTKPEDEVTVNSKEIVAAPPPTVAEKEDIEKMDTSAPAVSTS